MLCLLNCISQTQFYHCCFHTLMNSQIRPVVVWLWPDWSVWSDNERVDVVAHRIKQGFRVPSGRVTIEEDNNLNFPLPLTFYFPQAFAVHWDLVELVCFCWCFFSGSALSFFSQIFCFVVGVNYNRWGRAFYFSAWEWVYTRRARAEADGDMERRSFVTFGSDLEGALKASVMAKHFLAVPRCIRGEPILFKNIFL